MFLAAGQAPAPDETKIQLWTLPEGQLPERVVYRTTTFGPINIPAGQTDVVSNISRSMGDLSVLERSPAAAGAAGAGGRPSGAMNPNFLLGEVIGMTPHAHQLATSMHAKLQRADGSTVCLDDVRWDFHWQFDYIFASGVPYTSSDMFVADCVFDNSPANQPVIDGVKQQPRDLKFGERSIDEMCEHYIWLRFERDAFLKARNAMPL